MTDLDDVERLAAKIARTEGTFLRIGREPHQCNLPTAGSISEQWPRGTRWQCNECGTRYRMGDYSWYMLPLDAWRSYGLWSYAGAAAAIGLIVILFSAAVRSLPVLGVGIVCWVLAALLALWQLRRDGW